MVKQEGDYGMKHAETVGGEVTIVTVNFGGKPARWYIKMFRSLFGRCPECGSRMKVMFSDLGPLGNYCPECGAER